MKKKLCLLMALVCCVAVFAMAFAACNDNGGKSGGNGSGNGGGAGDGIFTEGASLEDIIAALESAESLTMTTWTNHVTDGEALIEYKFSADGILDTTSVSYEVNGTPMQAMFVGYQYCADGITYSVDSYSYDGDLIMEEASKDLQYLNPLSFDYFLGEGMTIREIIEAYLTTDEDGNIVLSDNIVGDNDDYYDYLEGSGYVKFAGSSIEIGWSYEDPDDLGDAIEKHKFSISGVNTTTVEIPDEVRALEAEAEWSLWVDYKGVTYRKEIDENGQEYYYVHEKDDESAVPETTINTLPVR